MSWWIRDPAREHIITLTHGRRRDKAECRCGWAAASTAGSSLLGMAIAGHRAEMGLLR